jgi:hypothetical protein
MRGPAGSPVTCLVRLAGGPVSRRAARHLAMLLIGAGGLLLLAVEIISCSRGSWLGELCGLPLFGLWVWAMGRFDADTETWGPW